MALNIELLKKVRRKIKSVPYAYDQGYAFRASHLAPCGTACCIGGWADTLSAPSFAERRKRMAGAIRLNRAANKLGLKGRDFFSEFSTERGVLFDGNPGRAWPEPFCSQWRQARTYESRSAVAVAYLTHIIKTGKVLE